MYIYAFWRRPAQPDDTRLRPQEGQRPHARRLPAERKPLYKPYGNTLIISALRPTSVQVTLKTAQFTPIKCRKTRQNHRQKAIFQDLKGDLWPCKRPPLTFKEAGFYDKNCKNRPFHRYKTILRFLFRDFILSNVLTYGRAYLFIIPHKHATTIRHITHRHRRAVAPPP